MRNNWGDLCMVKSCVAGITQISFRWAQLLNHSHRMASGNSKEGEGWKKVPTGTKRKAPVIPEHLQLLNRFTTLKAEEELDLLSGRAPWPTWATKKHQEEAATDSSGWLPAARDRGTWPGLSYREVCYFPEAQVQLVAEWLMKAD